jgi:hypothetical protein
VSNDPSLEELKVLEEKLNLIDEELNRIENNLKALHLPHQRGYLTDNSLFQAGVVNGVFTRTVAFRLMDYLDRIANNGYFYARAGDFRIQLNNGPLIYLYAGTIINLGLQNEVFDIENVTITPVTPPGTMRLFLI